MSLILIVLFVGVILVLYTKYTNNRAKIIEVTKNFASPPRVPYLGMSMVSRTRKINPIEIFNTIMGFPKKYGPNIALFGILNHVELMITRPEDIETIMTSKNTKKAHLYSFIEPWLGEGLLISHGTKWFNRRKIITPTFHFKILEQFIDVFNEQDKKLAQKLENYVNKEVNMYECITAIALDNICETAMGVKINAQDNPNSEYIKAVKEMSEIVFNRIFSILNQFPLLWSITPEAWRARKVILKLHKFTDSVINDRRKQLNTLGTQQHSSTDHDEIGKKQRFSFLDMLLQANIDGESLSHLDIREEVDTFMFEGHDTTTSGMSFAIYHLAMNPDVQEKAFDELRKIMGDDPNIPVTFENLQEMKYLDKVIKETLRLHPSVALIGRKTLEPIQIQGVTIPPGFDIAIPIYAIHRNPDIFPDPEKYDPERFDEEKERSWGPFDYIPFSAGQRNCVGKSTAFKSTALILCVYMLSELTNEILAGQKFAMLEMKAVLSTILRHYKVVATEKTIKMIFRSDLILRPINGLYVGLEKRGYQ